MVSAGIFLGLPGTGGAPVYGQMTGTGGYGVPVGIPNAPDTAFGGAADPGAIQIQDGYRIIPSIAAAERYDSNVYFAPKTPGLNRGDYVSTLAPQIRGLYAGNLFKVNAMAAGVGEYYVNNPGLNYIGTNATAAIDASGLVNQWWKGSHLIVSDSFFYSPQPPSFAVWNLDVGTYNPYV